MKKPLASRHPKLRLWSCLSRYGLVRGLGLYIQLRRLLSTSRQSAAAHPVTLHVPGLPHPVYLRPGTSDVKAFIQVILFHEYHLTHSITPRFILDGGGNIGMTAVYFANIYPDAKILSVEPDSGNFKTLQLNVAAYPNITALQGGIWEKTTHLVIRDGGLGEWNYIVEEARPGETGIPAYAISDLMQTYAPDGFDLVKLDIEGSEKVVMVAPDVDTWLTPAKTFITELHDRMIPGCSKSFLDAIARHGFIVEPNGESLVCSRL